MTLETVRAINQYLFLIAFGAAFYGGVVAIGWHTIIQKRLLVVLLCYPLAGAYGSHAATTADTPATTGSIVFAVLNLATIIACVTIRKPRPPS